jgi:hypothetical protein
MSGLNCTIRSHSRGPDSERLSWEDRDRLSDRDFYVAIAPQGHQRQDE